MHPANSPQHPCSRHRGECARIPRVGDAGPPTMGSQSPEVQRAYQGVKSEIGDGLQNSLGLHPRSCRRGPLLIASSTLPGARPQRGRWLSAAFDLEPEEQQSRPHTTHRGCASAPLGGKILISPEHGRVLISPGISSSVMFCDTLPGWGAAPLPSPVVLPDCATHDDKRHLLWDKTQH